jgi:adenylate cyclase
MQNEIKKLEKVKIGISINSGEAIIGNVGSEEFVDYTAIGDVVNTASRLQAFAGPGEIVISESTYKMLIKSGEKKNKFIKKGAFKVKGKEKPVVVYKVKY